MRSTAGGTSRNWGKERIATIHISHYRGASRSHVGSDPACRSYRQRKHCCIDLMDLSIVIPVKNEADNIAPLVGEICALRSTV